jgi:hypothetical protein
MKAVKYPESIFCDACKEHVKMTNCRVLRTKSKGKTQVEFDYVCVSCGHRDSASRDSEYLQFSEREFCQAKGLALTVPGKLSTPVGRR